MRRSQQHHPTVDIVQYQLDASIHLANAVFTGTERIDRAMLDVTHEAVDWQLKFVRAAADIRDPAKVADLQVAMSGRPEKAIHCQQEIMSALVEIQAEFGRSTRDCMEKCTQLTSAPERQQFRGQSGPAPRRHGQSLLGMISLWEQAF